MDELTLGRLIGELQHRLAVLETEWRAAKKLLRKFWHYGKRGALIAAIYLLNLLAQTPSEVILMKIKWAFGLMANLLGLAL